MKQEPLLQVKNLRIVVEQSRETSTPLIHGVSFDVYKSEIVGVVGESGSGKSLTSLSILQLLDEKLSIESESITFGESKLRLQELPEKEMRSIRGKQIAMVFQEPMSSLNPLMRCGKQVDEMMEIHASKSKLEIKEHTLSLFRQVQLPDPERAYRAYPHELSGGQLQRVMIAMAISCNPLLLIADECTTALDVTVQKEILDLLKQLNKDLGISILFISHDLDVISQISDRVIVMKDGRIVEQGNIEQIFKAPKDSYTMRLIASKPPLGVKLDRLPKPRSFETSIGDDGDFNDFTERFIQKHQISATSMELRRKMLEEAENVLQVRDLVKSYPIKSNFWGKPTAYLKAVDNVNFVVKKGETVGLVGESGCGKSTLSKALLRLIEPDAGDVFFKGESVTDWNRKTLNRKRKEIQYIFQDPYSSLNPRHTIGYAILEPMTVHRILPTQRQRRERVEELLELVGLLPEHYARYPHQFSGGQRQRICIARALSMNPEFIVCDEIVSALDVSVQAQVLNLLMELREQFDLSLLFVSHDLSIVKFVSDRLLVMRAGKIVEYGWSEDIYRDPQNDYTKTLFNAIPKPKTI